MKKLFCVLICTLLVGCSSKSVSSDKDVPIFSQFQDTVEVNEGEDVDLEDYFKVEDASSYTVKYDDSTIDLNTPGKYEVQIIAEDEYGNVNTKDMTVLVKSFKGLYKNSVRTTIYKEMNTNSSVVGTFREGFYVYVDSFEKDENGMYWAKLSNGYVRLDDTLVYKKGLEYRDIDFNSYEEFASACQIEAGGIGGIFKQGTFTGEVHTTITCTEWPVIY